MAEDRFQIVMKRLYIAAFVIAVFTGFGNMPIYGRFFIADIPGFGWADDFFLNLHIHYLSGAVLLMIATFFAIIYSRRIAGTARLSTVGSILSILLGLTLSSGVLSAVKNLPVVNLSMVSLMVIVFTHLGAAMALILVSVWSWIMKKRWLAGNHKRPIQDVEQLKTD